MMPSHAAQNGREGFDPHGIVQRDDFVVFAVKLCCYPHMRAALS